MSWIVEFVEEFEPEFDHLPRAVQDELLAQASVIGAFGPQTGRPRVDALHGSRHASMKELRFEVAGGVWRVAFAFDRRRRAVLLACGDKSGRSQRHFYRSLIRLADSRFDAHRARLDK